MESLQSNYVDNSPQPPPPAETPADGGGSEYDSQKFPPGSNPNYSNSSYSFPQVDTQFQNHSEQAHDEKENLIDSRIHENGNSNGLGHSNNKVASAGDGGRLAKLELQRPLLSDTALTNTHSGTDKDQSGGEEETTSRRRRRSRWDPPPTDSSNDGKADSASDSGTGTGGRKRKSRWSDDQPQPVIQLPDFMRELTGGIEFDPEIQALNARLLEITRKLQSGSPLDDRPEGARSPSPEPIYDNAGVRINTREYRAREKLTRERQEIISQMIKKNPAFKPPADYRPPKLHRKLYIPMKEYPGYNFIGLIIGPRGNTQKRMERETGAKIVIRGKGSVKEGKWLQKRDMKPDPSENEDLHVLVEADTQESLDGACAMLEKLLQPVDEVLNEHKRQQLRELATLNGTIRDEEICRLCGEPGHRQYACPSKNSTFKSDVLCKICGDGGHPTIDCPVKNTTGKKMDDEYQNFLAELGGSVPESATKQTATLALGPGTSGSNPPWASGGNTAGLGAATVGAGDGKPKEYDETNLYIGYLPPTLDDDGLISLFSPYGEIVMAKVIKDRVSQLSKGYGFVKYADVQQANNAIASMNGHRLEGRTIAVRVAGKPPPPAVPPGPPAPSPAPAPAMPSYMLPGQPTGLYPSQQQHAVGGPIGNAPVGSFTGAPPPWGPPMPHPYSHYPPPPGANMYPPPPGNPVSPYTLHYPPHVLTASSGGPSQNVSSGEGQQAYSASDSLPSYPGHSIGSSPLPSVPANVYGSSVSTIPTSSHYPAPSYSYPGYYGGAPPSQPPPPPPPHIDQSLSFSNVPWASHQPPPPPDSSSAPDAEYEKFMADMK